MTRPRCRVSAAPRSRASFSPRARRASSARLSRSEASRSRCGSSWAMSCVAPSRRRLAISGRGSPPGCASDRFRRSSVNAWRSRPYGASGPVRRESGVPAGSPRNASFLVEPLGAAAEETQPAEEDDAGDGVRRLDETSAGQVVVDEPLGVEPGEEAAGDPLLQVQVDAVTRQPSRVPEKATGRTGAFSRQSVSFCSGFRGARSASSVASQPLRWASEGNSQSPAPSSSARRVSGSAPKISSEQESASRNASSSNPTHCRDRASRSRHSSFAASSASWRRRVASSSASLIRRRAASRSAFSIQRASCPASRWRMPRRSRPLDVVLDHPGEAAELALDRLGLPHQDVEHPILLALGQLEVAAAHFRRGLELAVNAPVSLLDAPRIPRQVEVEKGPYSAPGSFNPSRAASVASRMRSGSSAGGRLNRRWISRRRAPATRPSIVAIRSSARSVPAMAASSIFRR